MTSGSGRRWLFLAIAAGALVRVAALSQTADLGPVIVDEQHYVQIATSLVKGDGFAWGPDRPTSIRPPLFPAVLAGIWTISGIGDLQAVRVVQVMLSALTAALVYQLGRRLFDPTSAAAAAVFVWVYPSFVFFNITVLTETLFTLLLVAFTLLAVQLLQRPSMLAAAACGVVLGLATLTRSVLWPLPLALCPLLTLTLRTSVAQRLALPAVLLAAFAVTLAPWAVRNTRLQGVPTIVDTMGGINLRMGNYEHTPDDRMWDAVSLTGERNWVHGIGEAYPDRLPTEGEKDKWAQAKALDYIQAHPFTTLRRSLIKFADFWGIERELIAGVRADLFSMPLWLALGIAVLTAAAYIALAVFSVAALWLLPLDWRVHAVVLLGPLAIVLAHSLVFGHSRYHVPLAAILAIYATAGLRTPPSQWRASNIARIGAAVSVVVLAAIWVREIVFVEARRLGSLWPS